MLKLLKLNQRGNAMFEIIPVLLMFILLINFTLGFFGMIHSGTLNSIAGRNYLFETFRNRTNLFYFRDADTTDISVNYKAIGYRFSLVRSESSFEPQNFVATSRFPRFSDIQSPPDPISLDFSPRRTQASTIQESEKVSDINEEGVNPVWIRTHYGICLNSKCEP